MNGATQPRLRPYRATDGPFIEKLTRAEFREYSPRAGATSVRAATLPGVTVIVAEVQDVPIGFVMVSFRTGSDEESPPPGVAALDVIAVDAAHRGRGVGQLLLEGAVHEATRRRSVEIRLMTAEANVAALDLFLRSGFEIVERIERYYPRGQNAVGMRKKLA